jgi:hypothetical protein
MAGGIVTQPWLMFFQYLLTRFGQPIGGWVPPTGTVSRATFDADWTVAISDPPTQAEVEAVRDQVIVLQKRLAALEQDSLSIGTISGQ